MKRGGVLLFNLLKEGSEMFALLKCSTGVYVNGCAGIGKCLGVQSFSTRYELLEGLQFVLSNEMYNKKSH